MLDTAGSEGEPPLPDPAGRHRKLGQPGFAPPDAKRDFSPPDSGKSRSLAASGWVSDLRRGPRGVLKRKGEVIGGYGVGGSGRLDTRTPDVAGSARRRKVEPPSGAQAKRMGMGGLRVEGEEVVSGGYQVPGFGRELLDGEALRATEGRYCTGSGRSNWMEESWRSPSPRERRTEFGMESCEEVIQVGRGGVLKYRPSSKKASNVEKSSFSIRIGSQVCRRSVDDDNDEEDDDASHGTGQARSYDHVPPISRESKDVPGNAVGCDNLRIKVWDELIPVAIPVARKRHKKHLPSADEVARERMQPLVRKSDLKESNQSAVQVDCNSALEASGSTRKNAGPRKVSRGSEKQKVREQIKSMLIDAGWNIELRPRKNRDYEDSVYVSPQGTGYWSITKAYEAFLLHHKQTNGAGDLSVGCTSRKSSAQETDGDSLDKPNGPALSTDALSILKRNVVNKRTSKKDPKDNDKRPAGLMDPCSNEKYVTDLNISLPTCDENLLSSSDDPCIPEGRQKKEVCWTLLPRNFKQGPDSMADEHVPYSGKRTVLSWMIDLESLPANGKVKYMNQRRTRALLEGWITREGIHCSCCSKILPVLKFEIHAGSKLRQPYQNIFVESSGSSLLECLLAAWRSQEMCKRNGFSSVDFSDSDPNDDMCGICGEGGDLFCCDGCPSAFHLGCLGFEMLPAGDWHCSACTCKFCGQVHRSRSHSSPVSMLLSCYLCQAKYHQDCVPEVHRTSVDFSSSHASFCGSSCRKINEKLQKLVGVKNELDAGLSWSIVQRFDVDSVTCPPGLVQRAETNAKVAVALEVLAECFSPMVDKKSGINLINNIVFNCGSNLQRLNFSGVYTFILERDEEMIAAAPIRLCGANFAEMPFIGTRVMYRRQGMCRLLLQAIESALSHLDIEKLVTPAIPQLLGIWTRAFGFKPSHGSSCHGLKSRSIITFPGMSLLVKELSKETKITVNEDNLHTASNHQPAAILSPKRSCPEFACNKRSKNGRKGFCNWTTKDEEPDWTQGSCMVAESQKLMGAAFFAKPNKLRNHKTSPLSSANRKERHRTHVANSSVISEDVASDACGDEENDACLASIGNDTASCSDRGSNGAAVSVPDRNSCYLF